MVRCISNNDFLLVNGALCKAFLSFSEKLYENGLDMTQGLAPLSLVGGGFLVSKRIQNKGLFLQDTCDLFVSSA